MIQYKCPLCGTEIETDEALSGKQDTCPECGRVHSVPLSKADLAKRKAAQREQKRALEEAERERNRVAAEVREKKWAEMREKERVQMAGKQEKKGRQTASATEQALGFIGGLYLLLGVIVGLVGFGLAMSNDNGGFAFLALVIGVAGGFLCGIPFFAAYHVLRYLRRIMNAVEETNLLMVLRKSDEGRDPVGPVR